MTKLSTLLAHSHCNDVTLHVEDNTSHFMYKGKKYKGLHRVLQRYLPVPVIKSTGKRTRVCRACAKGNKNHGSWVDTQLTEVCYGGASDRLDPCTRNVLNVFAQKGWKMVATQVNLLCPALKCATAIDVLCTDEATEQQLILVEVKSSKQVQEGSYFAHTANRDNLPMSYYMQHQLQLFAMYMAIQECDVKLDGAYVIRTYPYGAYCHPLSSRLKHNGLSLPLFKDIRQTDESE